MKIYCVICLRPIRRRWWQWGPLAPLRVHDWSQQSDCKR